ncbi:hypothetical protein BB560_006753 [Smittium megazygosporum]|uniref:Uncharacterized protein n=1 Tax=Smittium megazygosporum TaxID=133381 RepID=A0A2T9Y1X8_9FUNG|nr:hypothetical protein BB560_006753 [Smittium megazygosporum]
MEGSEIDDFECSTSDAIDEIFHCWRKQVKNVYRYGNKLDCSKYWEKFKLCAKIKFQTTEARENSIKNYLEKQKIKKETEPNLYDVWTERTEPPEQFAK